MIVAMLLDLLYVFRRVEKQFDFILTMPLDLLDVLRRVEQR